MLRFKIGRNETLPGRSPQARRFHMVAAADVIVSIEGGRGTGSVIELALALERPILPLPFGDETSRSRKWWSDEDTHKYVCERFRIDEGVARK